MVHRIGGIGMGVLIAAFLIALAWFVIAAVIGVLRSSLGGGMKLVWIVLVFLAPFLGSLLWYVIGRPQALRPRPHGRRT